MYDYHAHTIFSADAVDSLDQMISTAADKGYSEIAITDHDDALHPETLTPSYLDLDAYTQALTDAAGRWNRPGSPITLIRGMEIGMTLGDALVQGSKDAQSYDFDFIIGSVHAARGGYIDEDVYLGKRSYEAKIRDYYQELIDCLKVFDNFDVIGHINNIDRYVDHYPENELFMDLADEAMTRIIDMGKGIEINTSSYRKGMGDRTTPTLDILKRYKALGGEILTIGSDAHRTGDVGRGLDKGLELAKAAGFEYLTTFRLRKPSFIKISNLS
jgi:histidinol-phosphatase (PHP family)